MKRPESFDKDLRQRSLTDVFAVLISFGTLVTLQSTGLFVKDALSAPRSAEVLLYILAVAAAIAVMRLLCRGLPRRGTKALPVSVAAASLCVLAVLLVLSLAPALSSGNALHSTRSVRELAHAAFFGVLVKPAAEEYLFRGLYTGALCRATGAVPFGEHIGVLISSVLFAVWHTGDRLIPLAAGLLLGELTLYATRRGAKKPLVFPIAVHAAYNGVLYAVELFYIINTQ